MINHTKSNPFIKLNVTKSPQRLAYEARLTKHQLVTDSIAHEITGTDNSIFSIWDKAFFALLSIACLIAYFN